MKILSNTFNNRSGMTMIIVMGVTLLSSAMMASVLFSVKNRVRLSNRQVQLEQAFYLAEAGMERAANHIIDNETDVTLTGTLGEGSYKAVVVCTSLSGGEIGIEVFSTGTVQNVSRGVTVRGLRRVSWARFALWYDQQAMSLVMVPGEKFRGWFYSKPKLIFHNKDLDKNGQVHFYDKAWTVADEYECYTGAAPIFDKGIVTSSAEQTMTSVDLSDLKTKATANGLVLDGDATIEMDGSTVKITNTKEGWVDQVVSVPEDSLIYAQSYTYTTTTTESYYSRRSKKWITYTTTSTVTEPGDISVKAPNGLEGRLTLVSEGDINIIDHVRYQTNPNPQVAGYDPTSTDALGLIANDNVVVTTDAPDDLDIYAHILCKNGGFGVSNYSSGSERGSLNVYGGIANLIRNAVGTTSPSGYIKNYAFDSRFINDPPPYYPRLVDELEWAGWEG